MDLFAKDRDMDVGCQPRTCDRTETQLFHAFHNAAHGTLSLHELNHGGAEGFARGLFPKGWEAYRLLHGRCPKTETSLKLKKSGDFPRLMTGWPWYGGIYTHDIFQRNLSSVP